LLKATIPTAGCGWRVASADSAFPFRSPGFQEVVSSFPVFREIATLFGTVGPGRWHILGTDEQARDQLSRLIHGGRISLSIGLIGIALSFPLGMLVGGIAGYFGGWVDAVLMRLVEVIMTIPDILSVGGVGSSVTSDAVQHPALFADYSDYLICAVDRAGAGGAGVRCCR
jgi:ABC-type dipeptide/oligopeptide/nickel transport system permease subunit